MCCMYAFVVFLSNMSGGQFVRFDAEHNNNKQVLYHILIYSIFIYTYWLCIQGVPKKTEPA